MSLGCACLPRSRGGDTGRGGDAGVMRGSGRFVLSAGDQERTKLMCLVTGNVNLDSTVITVVPTGKLLFHFSN